MVSTGTDKDTPKALTQAEIDAFNKAVNDMDEAVLDLRVQVSAAKKKLKEYQDGKDLDAAKIAKLEGDIRDLTLKMQSTCGLLDGTFVLPELEKMKLKVDIAEAITNEINKIRTKLVESGEITSNEMLYYSLYWSSMGLWRYTGTSNDPIQGQLFRARALDTILPAKWKTPDPIHVDLDHPKYEEFARMDGQHPKPL